ncbi:MAG: TonB C-terminal domain-containing protein [Methylophaga sp.]|nr:TonB C-terminal domain-containing protein [Methylophaga sp.]
MKLWLFLTILTTSMCGYAEISDKQVSECAIHKDPLSRLDCLDQLIAEKGLSGGVKSSVKTEGKGKWLVRTDVSPIDDSTNVYAELMSENIVGSGYRAQKASLVLRCSENVTNVYVRWNDYLGLKSTSVLQRLDKEKATNHRWTLSSDNTATFVSGGYIRYIKKLLGHKKLLLQLTPYNDNPVMAVFDLTGIDEAIKPIKKACHWSSNTSKQSNKNVNNNSTKKLTLDEFMFNLEAQVKRYWIKPTYYLGEGTGEYIIYLFDDGSVKRASTKVSSGNLVLDRSVENAIYKASPFLGAPKTWNGAFTFSFSVRITK